MKAIIQLKNNNGNILDVCVENVKKAYTKVYETKGFAEQFIMTHLIDQGVMKVEDCSMIHILHCEESISFYVDESSIGQINGILSWIHN